MRKTTHHLERGFIFLRAVFLFCGFFCALAALVFWIGWYMSWQVRDTGDKAMAAWLVALLSVASLLSFIAAVRKK